MTKEQTSACKPKPPLGLLLKGDQREFLCQQASGFLTHTLVASKFLACLSAWQCSHNAFICSLPGQAAGKHGHGELHRAQQNCSAAGLIRGAPFIITPMTQVREPQRNEKDKALGSACIRACVPWPKCHTGWQAASTDPPFLTLIQLVVMQEGLFMVYQGI